MAKEKFTPFPVGDRAAFIRKAAVALEIVDVPTALVLTYTIAYDRVEVAHIPVTEIQEDANTKSQFYRDGNHVEGGPSALARTHLSWLRSQALRGGATPEAVRLLEKATGVFTKKEEKEMAEKLKAKSAAKPDKEGLKTAAKAAPVAKGSNGGGRKGNAEALAKAREARNVNRKYTVNTKLKDIKVREGSWTEYMLKTILGNKDTDSAKSAHAASKQFEGKNLDFSWANSKGYITLK